MWLAQGDDGDRYGAYLLNVVVKDEWQRQGCGTAMIVRAEEDAAQLWSASRIYTKVDAENEVGVPLLQEISVKKAWSVYLSIQWGVGHQLCGYV